MIRAVVGIGAVVGFLLAAQGDRIGRRRLLLITVTGYTLATLATALAQNLMWLATAQFVAEIFLQGEWAVAITIIVEEFPHEHRGRALGAVKHSIITGCWHMLTIGELYREAGGDYFSRPTPNAPPAGSSRNSNGSDTASRSRPLLDPPVISSQNRPVIPGGAGHTAGR